MILILLWLAAAAAASSTSSSSSSCNLICECSFPKTEANCSRRGLLTMPVSLPTSVQSIDLSQNELLSINATEISLTELRVLNLSRNHLTEITRGRYNKIRTLDLSYNNVTSVRSLHLELFRNLIELNLAHNKISYLTADGFPSPSVRILNLRNNRIVKLEKGCLDSLTSLEELLLTKNRLTSFPKDVFKNMKNLRIMEANKNKFVKIEGLSFLGLTNLTILKLKRNQIKYLTDGAFFGLEKIRQLYLDRNRVPTVEKGWLYGLGTLEILSLSNNSVEHIAEDAWEVLGDLSVLNLRSNFLQLLNRDTLRSLPKLKHLYLEDNRISHIDDESGTVDVFAEVPSIEVLTLDGNEISHTIEDMDSPFKGLRKLRKLSLSRNFIRSIGKRAFEGNLENLVEIDVRNNVISTIQENAFINLSNLKYLKLDSKSILCDCYFKWLPKYLNETGIKGASEAKCAHPEALKSRNITSIAYESFTCDDFPKPYILLQPQTQITLRNHNLTLYCRAASTSPVPMTFEWKLDSEVLNTVNCSESLQPRRCVVNKAHSFDGKGREITSELHLNFLTYDDAGRYQCVVANKFGATYSDKANITVYVFPTFIVTPKDIVVRGGSSATFQCAGQGVPAPKVFWTKRSDTSDFPAARERRIVQTLTSLNNDKRVTVNSFVILNVSVTDMGVYSCTVKNPAGSISRNITLDVLEPPGFVKPMQDKKSVSEGEMASFNCSFYGSPKPKLSWTKDGHELLATERHFFVADKLIIVETRPSDAGRYECTIQNQLGTGVQASVLTVSAASIREGGGGGGFVGESTTGIIIIALVCCVVLTSLVWVIIFYKVRKNSERREERRRNGFDDNIVPESYPLRGGGGGRVMDMTSQPGLGEFNIGVHVVRRNHIQEQQQLPLDSRSVSSPESHPMKDRGDPGGDEKESEKDSGTGNSKRSYENGDDHEYVNLLPQSSSSRMDVEEVLETDDVIDIDDEDDDDEVQRLLRGGGGESAISLSEFVDNSDLLQQIPFADDDDSSNSNPRSSSQSTDIHRLRNGHHDDDDNYSYSIISDSVVQQPIERKPKPEQPEAEQPPEVAFRTFHKKNEKAVSSVHLNNLTSFKNNSQLNSSSDYYRGGGGTLPPPMQRIQSELLEASLNSYFLSDYITSSSLSSYPKRRRIRRRSSSSFVGGGSRKKYKKRSSSSPEHSDVALKSKDMFN